MNFLPRQFRRAALAALSIPLLAAPILQGETLKIFLLLGQSNMEGQAYTYDNVNTAGWNIPTMEFLLSGTPAATTYLGNMPHTFKGSLNSSWLDPRDDVWCVQYDSTNGSARNVLATRDAADIVNGIAPLSPGFGVNTGFGSMIGAELAMGIRLGETTAAPIFLFKSNKGGTTLGNDWRSPSAVAARGGVVGAHFRNSMNRFIEFLNVLDADLADDGRLNAYLDATSYEVAGVFWFQGFNEQFDDAPYTAAQLQAEYAENLKDLIYSIRALDVRIPGNLGIVICESSDQDAGLNASRISAVAQLDGEIPNSAAYFDTDNLIGTNWGNGEGGAPFSTGWGFHFNARAENFLEIGWQAAGAVLDSGFLGEGAPLYFGVSAVTSVSFDQATVSAGLNEDAEVVTVVWDTMDQGTDSTDDWAHAQSLGSWTGGAGEISAILMALAEDRTYHFRFFASSAGLGAHTWSPLGSFTTTFENPPPLLGVPTHELPTSEGALLACELSRADAISTHLVWAFEDQGESDLGTWHAAGGGGSVSLGSAMAGELLAYDLSVLEAATSYVVRFSAVNAFGTVWSLPLSLRTARVEGDLRLTAYYDFEGDAAGALRDYPGAGSFADDLTGFNATFTAEVSAKAKGSAQAASFDGNTALFTDAHTSDLGPDPDAYTIMFWVKGRDIDQENNNTRLMTSRVLPNGSNSSRGRWQVEGFGNDGSRGDGMDVRLQSSDLPAIWFQPDAVNALARQDQGETVAEWHHVAFVMSNSGHPGDGGAFGRTFVDGVQVGGTLNVNPVFDRLAIGNSDGQLIIGGHSENAGSRAFTGLLDDVALFAGIVPDGDISAIALGAMSPAEFLVVDDAALRLAISRSGANLELTWRSRAGRAYNIRTDQGGIGLVDPDSWPFYLSFTNIAATPPENMLIIPRPIGDEDAYFVVEEVAAP